MATLIFFDINGTLIRRDARTDLPYTYALNELLAVENSMAGINTSARSDKDVFMEALEKQNLSFSETLWQDFLVLYRKQLEIFKTSDVWRENVDAIDFVNSISKTQPYLSLITGELSMGAQYKLEKLGIWSHFPTGGFGEDDLTRFGIADQALQKARDHYKQSFDQLIIIGDTLLDIKTGRHLGAKVISITTGSNTREELASLKPDIIIDKFQDLDDDFISQLFL
jgi:phosphoglycolate phosphatase-like HAD superfamily hydrolase